METGQDFWPKTQPRRWVSWSSTWTKKNSSSLNDVKSRNVATSQEPKPRFRCMLMSFVWVSQTATICGRRKSSKYHNASLWSHRALPVDELWRMSRHLTVIVSTASCFQQPHGAIVVPSTSPTLPSPCLSLIDPYIQLRGLGEHC